MNQLVLKRLYDAFASVDAVRDLIAGISLEEYLQNRMLRSAGERELMKAGEALHVARSLDRELEKMLPDLHRVIGLRLRIVHGYDDLVDSQIWSIALDEAPMLADELRGLLNEFGDFPV